MRSYIRLLGNDDDKDASSKPLFISDDILTPNQIASYFPISHKKKCLSDWGLTLTSQTPSLDAKILTSTKSSCWHGRYLLEVMTFWS